MDRPTDHWWINNNNGSGIMLQRGQKQIALIVTGNGNLGETIEAGQFIARACNALELNRGE